MSGVRIGNSVGAAVHRLRRDRKWSQEELAAHLSEVGLPWSRAQVAAIEALPPRGRSDVTLGEVLLLAETFGVSIAELIPGDDVIILGRTERPARAVRAALGGAEPANKGLRGPYAMPGMSPDLGPGPFYVKDVEEVPDPVTHPDRKRFNSVVYGSAEVDVARRLGVAVEAVRAAGESLREDGIWDGRVLDAERELRAKARLHLVEKSGGDINPSVGVDLEEVTRDLLEELRSRLGARADG